MNLEWFQTSLNQKGDCISTRVRCSAVDHREWKADPLFKIFLSTQNKSKASKRKVPCITECKLTKEEKKSYALCLNIGIYICVCVCVCVVGG
jgi:hypothetical protein